MALRANHHHRSVITGIVLFALAFLASIMENVNGESMFVTRKTRPRGMVEWKADGIFPCADRKTKDIKMPPFLLVLLILMIFVCAFGYMTYRHEAEKRAWEKKRNQFNDRV